MNTCISISKEIFGVRAHMRRRVQDQYMYPASRLFVCDTRLRSVFTPSSKAPIATPSHLPTYSPNGHETSRVRVPEHAVARARGLRHAVPLPRHPLRQPPPHEQGHMRVSWGALLGKSAVRADLLNTRQTRHDTPRSAPPSVTLAEMRAIEPAARAFAFPRLQQRGPKLQQRRPGDAVDVRRHQLQCVGYPSRFQSTMSPPQTQRTCSSSFQARCHCRNCTECARARPRRRR